MNATVICDGRGNAGTGARAACLLLPSGEWIDRAEKLPATTNIVAEHRAIQLGVELALEHGVTDLLIINDSRVPVNQVMRKFAVRQAHLKPLVEQTWELFSRLDTVAVEWKRRTETTRADRLCRAVDPPLN
jgi:ribonuclease HI